MSTSFEHLHAITRRLSFGLPLLVPLLPWLAGAWYLQTGNGWACWLTPLVLYGLVPLLDQLAGDDRTPAAAAADSRRYRGWLLAWLPLQYATVVLVLAWAAWLDPPWWQLLGLVASLGVVNAGGINVGHEWGHQRGALARWCARLALAASGYGHFLVEHNRGHHVRVATPEDPASARLGESLWAFLPRSILGGLASAWQLEARRLAAQRRSPLSWDNELLIGWALSLLLLALAWLSFGPIVLPLLLGQAVIAVVNLETVNYIEHYGLLRQRETTGRYERCGPQHSWNSERWLSNRLLFQLQRHADHHAHPTRPFPSLRYFPEAPQLPAGYPTLVPLAALPPLWFRLMDRRLLAHYRGDADRVHRRFA